MDKEVLEILNKLLVGQERLEQGQERLEQGQEKILKYIEEVDAKQATNHLEIINELTDIKGDLATVKKDIAFIGHKEYENEKEIFNIKKYLEIV